MNIAEIILLCAVPGLMFCIIPESGMEFNLSWQLAALWLCGVAFIAFLSSWWWRAFFFIALIRTATMEPAYDAYISLFTIAVFLAAAEGFHRIEPQRVMNAICGAAILLFGWVMVQKVGAGRPWICDFPTGPFNQVSAGVFFALCLPAFFRPRWWPLAIICFSGLVIASSTTAAIAAAAAMAVYFFLRSTSPKRIIAATAALIVLLGLWFFRVDSLDELIRAQRWVVWKHAAWSMRSEMLGRGLGSWKIVFPLLSSGDLRIGEVKNETGKIIMNNHHHDAHNEYVQATFELGIMAALLMVLFAGFMTWAILTRQAPIHAAAGVAALMVACIGWRVFHVAPLALLGCAWLGLLERRSAS
jgi:hypothetical protein